MKETGMEGPQGGRVGTKMIVEKMLAETLEDVMITRMKTKTAVELEAPRAPEFTAITISELTLTVMVLAAITTRMRSCTYTFETADT